MEVSLSGEFFFTAEKRELQRKRWLHRVDKASA